MHQKITDCMLCADRFAQTATKHAPRPVLWAQKGARVLIAGQAPGARVHASGKPFTDPSGDRLRDWLGLDEDEFYDRSRIAILPMAFCFPGYDVKGADLPPPPICAKTWRAAALDHFGPFDATILVGGYAMAWHLGGKPRVRDTVANWQNLPSGVFALPHPSWRNTSWLKKNPWFEADVLPKLRRTVRRVLND
ncbi:uracil-DNA glycosylase family protein [Algirhabdus cladophorae]|uniref:uracil-DNA glycosylase family protein n=1 Tax=Algirhabdus cladophorae TaxID=3377108 RepID=UPI003B8490EB